MSFRDRRSSGAALLRGHPDFLTEKMKKLLTPKETRFAGGRQDRETGRLTNAEGGVPCGRPVARERLSPGGSRPGRLCCLCHTFEFSFLARAHRLIGRSAATGTGPWPGNCSSGAFLPKVVRGGSWGAHSRCVCATRCLDLEPILTSVYGAVDRSRWSVYCRVSFMACAELFGYHDGREWGVGHFLWHLELN